MDAKSHLQREHEIMRLIIADDHELARGGLKDMLSDMFDIEVVGEASNGREAVLLCSRLIPDLVLMDVRMPEMDGLTATRELKRKNSKISVLMLTMHDNPDYLLEALKSGAAGYVLKDAEQQDLIDAIRQVRDGESPLDPKLAARLLRRMTQEGVGNGDRGPGGAATLAHPLTRREIEVLELLKLGLTNRQIAEKLVISVGTVKNHVEHIIAKLGASDRTQAVVSALEMRILDLSK